MNKYILLLLIIYLYIFPAFGSVATTGNQYNTDVNMTNNSNNILSESILIIPKEALNTVDTIIALQFVCAKDYYNAPNQNLVFRFFKYYGLGVFSPIDNSYITPSQCIDYQYQITWNLWSTETVDHNYDYAFGMYSASVTNGTWYYPYLSESGNLSNPYSYTWMNLSDYTPIINVSIVDMNGLTYYDNGSKLRNYPSFHVLGTLEPDVTPTPTPTPTATPTATPPPTTLPENETLPSDEWKGDNTTYNPNSTSPYSTIPNNTGLDQILKDDGLCANSTDGSCTAGDGIEWLNRHINDLFLLTFLFVLVVAWRLKS